MQALLDPQALGNAQGSYVPDGPLPPRIRALGFFPNTSDWLPGDIVLFSEVTPGLVGKLIRSQQNRLGYSQEHARWQHAAIYLGMDSICEAVFPRIRFEKLYDRLPNHLIRVRRMDGITEGVRYRIAINAMSQLKTFYGWPEVLRIPLISARAWISNSKNKSRDTALLCSQLCADSYARATNRVLSAAQSGRATIPADLSMSNQLQDVPTYWQPIASSP